jgi:hypothetical protein
MSFGIDFVKKLLRNRFWNQVCEEATIFGFNMLFLQFELVILNFFRGIVILILKRKKRYNEILTLTTAQ